MPAETNSEINYSAESQEANYSSPAEAPDSQQGWRSPNPEVATLIQSQASLNNRVKILTGLLIGTLIISVGSLVWSGQQADPPADADQIALESTEKIADDEAAAASEDESLLAADDKAITDNQSDNVTQRLAKLEQQIQGLSQGASGNVAAQVTEAKTQVATVSDNLSRAEAEIADLRNLVSALREAVDRQLAAPAIEPAQPVPDSIPETAPSN